MVRDGSKFLLYAFLLSIGAHLIIFVWLTYGKVAADHRGHGVVTVDFIQAVSHEDDLVKNQQVGALSKKTRVEKPSEQPANSNPSPAGPTNPALIGNPDAIAKESDLFLAEVTKLVDRNKIYPQDAISREQEGKVVVGITLDRNGNLIDTKIETPSPFQTLNEAAIKTLQGIHKYPDIPAIIPSPIHLHIPLVFRIERN